MKKKINKTATSPVLTDWSHVGDEPYQSAFQVPDFFSNLYDCPSQGVCYQWVPNS